MQNSLEFDNITKQVELSGLDARAKAILTDILLQLRKGELLQVIDFIIKDVVTLYDAQDNVKSVTILGIEVNPPEKFVEIIRNIKTAVFEKQLSKIKDYFEVHPFTAEGALLRRIFSKQNATLEDYQKIVSELKSFTTVANSKEFAQAFDQLSRFINKLTRISGYVKEYHFTPDGHGAINTYAFSLWEGIEGKPGDRYANAVRSPGSSIKDILRNEKIGSKTIADLLREIIREEIKQSNQALLKVGLLPTSEDADIDTWLKISGSGDTFSVVRKVLIARGMAGDDPLHDKVLLIKILETLDAGLNINCDRLYASYANFYDQFYNFFQKLSLKYPKIEEQKIMNILFSAKELLLVHSRDYNDIFKKQNEVLFLKPLLLKGKHIRSGEEIVVKFDQRDNEGIIKYLRDFKDRLGGAITPNITIKDIDKIITYLQKPTNAINNDKNLLALFQRIVTLKESMSECKVEVGDKLIVNQVKDRVKKINSIIKELQENGVDTQDIETAFNHLLAARKAVVNQNPQKIAIKEELLSIGQTFFNNYYQNEMASLISVQNKSAQVTGVGDSALAFTFDEEGAYVSVNLSPKVFLTDVDSPLGGTMTAFNKQGERADYNGKPDEYKSVLNFDAAIYLSAKPVGRGEIPVVDAKLIRLNIDSYKPEIQIETGVKGVGLKL